MGLLRWALIGCGVNLKNKGKTVGKAQTKKIDIKIRGQKLKVFVNGKEIENLLSLTVQADPGVHPRVSVDVLEPARDGEDAIFTRML